MKSILIVGLGSIGRRHAKIFSKFGHKVFGVDKRQDRLEQAKQELDIEEVSSDIDHLINNKSIDGAVISTPPHLHTDIGIKLANMGISLFTEKPLASNDVNLDILSKICEEKGIVFYTAYCYRFIPSAQKLKKLVDNNKIGKIYSARLQISSYLPDWHPWEDYRSFYMASKDQGGGALLDESHGIDLLRWLFGEIENVSAIVDKVSKLEIDSDDLAIMNLKFESGLIGEAHFDLLGRSPRVNLELIGENGTIIWDRIKPSISIYDSENKEWLEEKFSSDEMLTCYDNQAQHFIDCLDGKVKSLTTLDDGRNTLKVLLSAFKSSKTMSTVKV